MADAKTIFSLSMRDEASKQLKNFQGNFDRAIKGAESSTAGFDDAVGALSGGLGGLAGAVGLGATAAAVGMVGMAINDMATQAGQLELVRSSFDNLASGAGQSSDAMLAAMRNASQGMVSDYDLILAANKAMMLGVADTGEELASLLEIARTRGQAMGLTLSQAFNDIVTGLGRESALILDNLGITIDTAAAMDAYAKQLNTTTDALDGAQRKQALLNTVMAQTPASTGTAGSGVATAQQQAQAAGANASAAAGAFFAPIMREVEQSKAELFQRLTGTFDEFAARMQGIDDILADSVGDGMSAQWTQNFVDLRAAMDLAAQGLAAGVPVASTYAATLSSIASEAEYTRQITDQQARSIKQITALIADAIKADEAHKAALQAKSDAMKAQLGDLDNLAGAVAATRQRMEENRAATEQAALAVSGFGRVAAAGAADVATLEAAVAGLNARMAGMQPILASITQMRQAAIGQAQNLGLQAIQQGADPAQVTAMVTNATDALWNMGLSYDATTEAQFQNQIAVQNALGPMQSFTDGLRTANQEAQRLASGGLAQSQKAFDDLRSSISNSVSAIVQESLGLGDITWPGSDGRGGDAANENARRLAAIANEGLIGQDWLGEFATEVPDIFAALTASADPKAAAAQLLAEFQQGLRPELLDFEMIKQRVRDQLTSQQAIAAMTGDLTSQLMAEMGVSAAQVQSAMAGLGLPGTGDGATATGSAATTSITLTPEFDSTAMRAAGATALSEFVAGMDAPTAANKFSSSFMLSMKDFYGRFYASGAASANEYNNGFLMQFKSSVPVEVVLTLAALVTPEVLAALDARGSRTGALP